MNYLPKKKILIMSLILIMAFTSLSGQYEQAWKKSLYTQTVEIPGLENDYRFLFLTDTHMIVSDSADSSRTADNAVSRLKNFMNAEKVPSYKQIKEWVRYANSMPVDALLLGGDIIDYPSPSNIGHLKEQLENLEVPYLYTLGNHDWTYPWEYMTDAGKAAYLPLLSPFLQGNSAIHTLELEDLTLVAIDNSSNQINPEALAEYKNILSRGKPVIVMVHVPFITQSVLAKAKKIWKTKVVLGGGNYGGIYPNEVTQQFINLTTAKDSPVAAVLAGHVHFVDFDYIEGEKKIPQIVGGAGYQGVGVMVHVKGT